ncbi:autophagy protein 16-domain-containing protein [Kockiozyma suomiensis]|uniref:autophagy protein 16-domain-containing protein n=1 Tax=Kockiozyma suomiensis TaxID=1337062 RepID=UPI003343DC26
MNADWKSSFAAALDERDTRELQNYDMLDYYRRLVLRSITAESQATVRPVQVLNQDSGLQDELGTLKSKYLRLTQDFENLKLDRNAYEARFRTRDEEFKERTRSIQMLQDEILTYQIQLNIVEENASKLQSENKELVRRWMERVSREAEKLNDANAFLENLDRSVRHRETEEKQP